MNANTAKAVCKGKKRPRNTHEILGCRHKLSLHVFKLCFVFQLVPRTNVHQCVAIVGVVWVETGMCLTYTPSSNVIKVLPRDVKIFSRKKRETKKTLMSCSSITNFQRKWKWNLFRMSLFLSRWSAQVFELLQILYHITYANSKVFISGYT